MSDRTGGMIPGVFKKAVEKVNLMQPEFVLSVGDLIDGYTEDSTVWNAQWDEFESIVDKLEMPFYFVPGNHDISNSGLLNEWKRRLGAPYWYFIYKDVLFLALHTEDKVGGGLEKEQIEFVKNVLEKNSNVRWTMLFMHRPLWAYGEKSGYQEIEDLLAGRNYTLFSGHHHHYMKGVRNGMKHYVLATTGGGSYLRGAEFGEFEHVTWVTLLPDGPQVAHLELDGIFDENLIQEKDKELIQTLRLGQFLNIKPVFSEKAQSPNFKTKLIFSNPASKIMSISGELAALNSLEFYPNAVQVQIAPKSTKEIELTITNRDNKSIHELNELGKELELFASFTINEKKLSLPAKKRILFDSFHKIATYNTKETKEFIEINKPLFVQEDWDWKGAEDGTFKFAVEKDSKHLIITVETSDEKVILSSKNQAKDLQDKLMIHLNTDSAKVYEYNTITVAHSIGKSKTLIDTDIPKSFSVHAKTEQVNSNTRYEIAIPLKFIEKQQGKNWQKLRINIGWMDHDRPENTKPSVLWWRPLFTESETIEYSFFTR